MQKNKTNVHFKIEQADPNNQGRRGVHNAHDKNGNELTWENDKFTDGNGNSVKPAYKGGVIRSRNYAEATITIFEGTIENQVNSGSLQAEFRDPGITKNEAMVSVFAHEVEHNINKKDIAEIKGRYEGKGVNYRVDRIDYINNDFSDSYRISNAVYAEIP